MENSSSSIYSNSRLEWRRNKVLELSGEGHNQSEISRILQINQSTILIVVNAVNLYEAVEIAYIDNKELRQYLDVDGQNKIDKNLNGLWPFTYLIVDESRTDSSY